MNRSVVTWRRAVLVLAAAVLLTAAVVQAQRGRPAKRAAAARAQKSRAAKGPPSLNGFTLADCSIPVRRILGGGVAKDGIPALTRPKAVPAEKARHLRPHHLVIGVAIEDEQRAYPLRVLVWHENVNDVLGDKPIAVTYCPLCDSAVVFEREVGGEVREFGVSGLLWNSNVLLYDRQEPGRDESLWSQLSMKAVCGPAAKEELALTPLPSELVSWSQWRARYPGTEVVADPIRRSRYGT